MKNRRAIRVVAILAAVLGLSATAVPPASAKGTTDITFSGTASLAGGLGLPGVHGTPDLTPNANPGKKDPLFTVGGGNRRTGSFTSTTACEATGTNVDKPGKPVAWVAAPCVVHATFTVSGFCGLSSGRGSGFISIGGTWLAFFNFTWTDPIGGNLTFRGNYWKGSATKPATPEGDLTGTAKATPDPTGGGSCASKTQTRFILLPGKLTLTHPKALP